MGWPGELPSMAAQLDAALRRLDAMTLDEHIDFMVRHKQMTPEEAAECRTRIPAEKLAATIPVPPKPRRTKRRKAAPPAPAAPDHIPEAV